MKEVTNSDFTPLYGQKNVLSLYHEYPQKNAKGLLEGIEMVLYPGSKIEVVKETPDRFVQIKTPHYKVAHPVYVDRRYISVSGKRDFFLPSYEKALDNLKRIPDGVRYIYGANYQPGIPRLLEDFPPSVSLDEEQRKDWILEGLDCSGLFFQICEGATLRNCSMLDQVGEKIEITDIKQLRPLDLVLTSSHVAIVESSNVIVESALRFQGVKRSQLTQEFLHSEVFKGFRIIRPFFKNVDVFCDFFL